MGWGVSEKLLYLEEGGRALSLTSLTLPSVWRELRGTIRLKSATPHSQSGPSACQAPKSGPSVTQAPSRQNLFDSIRSEPFSIPEEDGNDLTYTFFKPDREGWLLKLGEAPCVGLGTGRQSGSGARLPSQPGDLEDKRDWLFRGGGKLVPPSKEALGGPYSELGVRWGVSACREPSGQASRMGLSSVPPSPCASGVPQEGPFGLGQDPSTSSCP